MPAPHTVQSSRHKDITQNTLESNRFRRLWCNAKHKLQWMRPLYIAAGGGGSPYLADVRREAIDAGLREGRAVVPHQLVVLRQLRRKIPHSKWYRLEAEVTRIERIDREVAS
jgi:hypothetical protein